MDILDAIDDISQLKRTQIQFSPDILLKKLFYDLDILKLKKNGKNRKNININLRLKDYQQLMTKNKTLQIVTQHLRQVVFQSQPKQISQSVKPKLVKKQIYCQNNADKVGLINEEDKDEQNVKQEFQNKTVSLVDNDYSD